jgi:hypothetical protein
VPKPWTLAASKATVSPPVSRRSIAGASSPTTWTSVTGSTTFSYRRISMRLVSSNPSIHGFDTVIELAVFWMTSRTWPMPAPATTFTVAPRSALSPCAVSKLGSPPTILRVRSPLERLLSRTSRVGTSAFALTSSNSTR